jgi:single-stranded-DNA-specific exonuclease
MSRPDSLNEYQWQVAPAARFKEPEKIARYHPVLLQVLYNRGIAKASEIAAFLDHQYSKSRDPFDLADMDLAVERIRAAIDNDEIITVYGDFDADGVTATVLLVEALRGMGLDRRQVVPYIPDRVNEGYGLNKAALDTIKKKGGSLVISVDCGIRSQEEILHAKEIGLDVIVTDHHSLGTTLPPADAVVNPRRSDSSYPEGKLAGVGLAFKLAQALRTALPERANYDEETLLDLVALGTVADLVPLLGENRVLVADGLQVINECRRPGIEALIEVAGLKPGSITSESIAFGLGPRVNAAGRLSHAYEAARLLAVKNLQSAREYAQVLDRLNRERRQLTALMTQKAEDIIQPDDLILFAADREFAPGVVGLVASQLADKHYRPAFVLEQGEEESRGSGRSIPGFHITEALDKVEELLVRHGGHAQAAGFTVRNEHLTELHGRLKEIASEELDEEKLSPSLSIDAQVLLPDIDWALQGVLAELEPTGNANARPIFISHNARVFNHRAVGQEQAHLQFWVGDSQTKHSCIAFRQGAWAGQLPEYVDLVFSISVNEWNGRREIQLVVKDIRAAESHSL